MSFYPAWLRMWHLLQALAFLVLVVTGLAIHFGGGLPFRLAIRLHDISGVALLVLFLFFVVQNQRTRNVLHYRLSRLAAMWQMARWYLVGMFRGAPRPFVRKAERKLNPLQSLSYLVVMYVLTPACALSGAVLLVPGMVPEQAFDRAGLLPIALLHLATAWGLSLFLVLHVYMITTGPTVTHFLKEILSGHSGGDP